MIIKRRGKQADKERLEILMRRFPRADLLVNEYAAACAGEGGEERFDFYIDRCGPKFPHLILHDVSLKSVSPFQLDSVMITPWCLYIFSVKNLKGVTEIRTNPAQSIHTKDDGSASGRRSPVEELETHAWLLEEWLMRHNLIAPIRTILVFSYPKQIPEGIPPGQIVLFSHQLPMFLAKLKAEPAVLRETEMREIADEMLRYHRPYVHAPICKDKRYPVSLMKKGVWCKDCGRLGMRRVHGYWVCSCGAKDKDAHKRAIRDWLLITGEPVTNRAAREMLGLDKVKIVNRLLREMDLERVGAYRGTGYQLKTHK
ncbi:nuclease-related domain-containing protein [Indiicoccus explosivorum]|uniref:nuclease-related domain-containing protein n=1 Tax=Indiicoccus explosivorum TaxID=1917864 RepID=UPI000B42F436|nr:nuclease-related domain-containing protein [Indiicoccus explosivorum]